MNTNKLLEILNNASRDELTDLPGIGPVLADRLVEARPYDSLEAVQTVKGISAKFIERLIDIPESQPDPVPVPEVPAVDEGPAASPIEDLKESLAEEEPATRAATSEGLSGTDETVNKREQADRQAVEALPEKFEQASESRGLLRTILVSSTITALVAILLTLAVLGGINGSLKFATSSQYGTIQREYSQLTTQLNTVQEDLVSLRGRVDTLEGLGERTVALEKAQQQLSAELESISQQASAIQAEATALNEKVTQQEERTLRFETFLRELQTSLGNLFAPQGETK
jgi:predicted  nucleic acid-binding Zn-ribbon protein